MIRWRGSLFLVGPGLTVWKLEDVQQPRSYLFILAWRFRRSGRTTNMNVSLPFDIQTLAFYTWRDLTFARSIIYPLSDRKSCSFSRCSAAACCPLLHSGRSCGAWVHLIWKCISPIRVHLYKCTIHCAIPKVQSFLALFFLYQRVSYRISSPSYIRSTWFFSGQLRYARLVHHKEM